MNRMVSESSSAKDISIGGDVNKSLVVGGSNNQLKINNLTINDLREPQPVMTGKRSNVPGGGSQTFVGREETLTQLHERLSEGKAVAITAIQGMGGIGKTELARQYAQRHESAYAGGVCWLQSRELDVASQIVEYAQVYLQLTVPEGMELPAQVAYCWNHWPPSQDSQTEEAEDGLANERVLVVYDDVTDYERVASMLPPEDGRFVVLMTTRRQHLATTVSPFEIEVLSEASALELLQQIVGVDRTSAELETAKAICEWVGYLPLGLELVGQYLRQKPEVTYEKLRGRLEGQRTAARALQKAHPGMTGKLGVIEAFELSWQTLSEDSRDVACWLSLFALAPIPWEVAESVVDEEEKEDFEDGRDALINRSLLRRVEVGSYQLHQLVREYFLAKLAQQEDSDGLRRAYCQAMVVLAQHMPNSPTRELLIRLTPVIPHIAEVITSWQDWLGDDNEELVLPFVAMARFYGGQGAYAQAEPWYSDCLEATQDRFGKEHPAVATSLNNLAALYRGQGRYEEAEPLYVQSLALMRKLFGEDHLDVTTGLNNLAALYESQGLYEEAEPLYVQSLALRLKFHDEDHPDVAISLNNLAALYDNQGRYEEAEPLYVQSLALMRKLLGEDHLTVAASLNNLAALYVNQGRYEEAEPLSVQSLVLMRKLLGEDHPDIATGLGNLASLYTSQGRYEEAEPLYVQSLALMRKLLGEDHLDVTTGLNNLAALYESQGRYEEAEPLYVQSLALRRKLLGEDHPNVAISLSNLASLYHNQGRYEEAEPLYVQALTLRRKLLSENHPDVAASLNNLAALHRSQGRYEEAEPLYVQAISILFNRLGLEHPNTNTVFNNFLQFVAIVTTEEKQSELSDHPLTQYVIEQLQAQPPQD